MRKASGHASLRNCFHKQQGESSSGWRAADSGLPLATPRHQTASSMWRLGRRCQEQDQPRAGDGTSEHTPVPCHPITSPQQMQPELQRHRSWFQLSLLPDSTFGILSFGSRAREQFCLVPGTWHSYVGTVEEGQKQGLWQGRKWESGSGGSSSSPGIAKSICLDRA